MTLWTELARASNAAGDEIILRTRNELFEIRYNGLELMSNLSHQSEDILAKRSLRLHGAPARRIFIGGLGMGFTLRTALRHLEPDAEIVVCELIPEIVEWNRTHLGHLADHPLRDPRVKVRIGDAMELLGKEREPFDVILMDTDNGPDFTVRTPNEAIYQSAGIGQIKQALKPAGIGAFWSATSSPAFEQELNKAAWHWRRDEVSLISGRVDAFHYIYFASQSAAKVGFLQAG
ncbi:spermidine synthase [Mycoplana ramosa]|uniref:spermidine synthase n=1 Tax=Mycoplana ramosa TaxID=40837 RepID=UPI004043D11B